MDVAVSASHPEVTTPLQTVESTLSEQEQQQTHQVRPAQSKPKSSKRRTKCRFYMTKKGCRAGDACPFSHDFNEGAATATRLPSVSVKDESAVAVASGAPTAKQSSETATIGHPTTTAPARSVVTQSTTATIRHPPTTAPSRSIVTRPTPAREVQDPRSFQLSQVRKRFASTLTEETLNNGTTDLSFKMAPSDPDFPFEIDALDCLMQVPQDFPKGNSKPSLRVRNKEMERGFQINVERGFDSIWNENPSTTLFNALKLLDKRLESLLVAEKVATIKIVTNRPSEITQAPPPQPRSTPTAQPRSQSPSQSPSHVSTNAVTQGPRYKPDIAPVSSERQRAASVRRATEMQILEHRLGKSPHFSKSRDGTTFTIPIEPRKKDALPLSLQAIKTFKLLVPSMYDIEPCKIQLDGVDSNDRHVKNVEASFLRRVLEKKDFSLLMHVNTLAQNIHIMATESASSDAPMRPPEVQQQTNDDLSTDVQRAKALSDAAVTRPRDLPEASDEGKGHVHFIPRPPEWSNAADEEGSEHDDTDSSFTSSFEDEDEDDDNQDGAEASTEAASSTPRERGIMLSFPHLELHGIELLELDILNLTIRCERCKETADIRNLRNNDRGDYTGLRSETCRKCAFSFTIGYRKDMMHVSSVRAGYIDVDGCVIVDMLPSTFVPTCSDCSSTLPPPGVVSVRGESSLAICRECHRRLTFKVPEVKFLNVGALSSHATAAASLPRKRKAKENLGIVAGEELPRRGRCKHYAKSQRWFRFSCCSKVFPCDKCHDEGSDGHTIEFANRMICGYCSREQNYRPEDCGICRAPLTGRKGTGFWEGGKGTRDRVRMSRKDARKFKRVGGSSSKANGASATKK